MNRDDIVRRIEADIKAHEAAQQAIERGYEAAMDLWEDGFRELRRRWWLAQPIARCEVLRHGCRRWVPVDLHVSYPWSGNPTFYLAGWTDTDDDGSYSLLSGVRVHTKRVERADLYGPGPHYRLAEGVVVTGERRMPW